MATPPKEITNESDNMDTDMETALSISALEGEWQVVVDMYRNHKAAHTMKIIGGRGTALHVAVNDGQQDVVKDLLESITGEGEQPQVLLERDERGDTPLHLAASGGFKSICKLIIEGSNKEERNKLVTIKNNIGETPLFLAALTWQKQTFAYLLHVFDFHNSEANQNSKHVINLQVLVRNDGIPSFTLPFADNISNTKGFTPLKLLANTPSAFRSASMLSWTWWRQIIYHCIEVKDLYVQRTIERYLNENDELAGDPHFVRLPLNYLTCYRFFRFSKLVAGFACCNILPSKKANQQRYEHFISMPLPKADYETSQSRSPERKPVPEIVKEDQNVLPPNYATFERFVKCAYLNALGICGAGIKDIRKIKKKHIWASQLLKALMQNPSESYIGSGGKPIEQLFKDTDEDMKQNLLNKEKDHEAKENIDWKEMALLIAAKSGIIDIVKEAEENIDEETALLIAAKNGIVEIVEVILHLIPSALHDTTTNKRNVFHVAIKYRQTLVVEALLNNLSKRNIKKMIQAVDNKENTVLHLAADAISIETPLKIPGSAVQMMWDIKWCEYIEGLVPKHLIFRTNKANKTSGEVFEESHKGLLKESSAWLKGTAENCSVVAALVAGVTFATSGSVPGGTEKGKPVLEGQLAFDVFGISALIGFCFSVTAL